MFRFSIRFIYVLYILIKSFTCSSVLASFGESCSNNLSCTYPLICSNTSKCICSASSSIWNNEQNDCLYCLPGWIEWENSRCLSFAVPSEGGLSYDQASDICHSYSAQLLHIYDINELKQFELKVQTLLQGTFSSAVTIFFRLGAWIDELNMKGLENIWCDENDEESSFECVYITRKHLTNGSLCLTRSKCNEEMLFICDMVAISEKSTIDNESNQRLAPLIGALAPLAIDLVGNLFGGNKQKPQQPTGPQQIIIQQEGGPSPQESSPDNTLLYVGLGIGGFLLLLLVCGAFAAIFFFTGCMKSSSSVRQANHRSSVESGYSYG